MVVSDPCLNLAIARLPTIGNQSFAIWVVNPPYTAGSILHDCFWTPELTRSWQAWQEMFALDRLIDRTFNPLINHNPIFSLADTSKSSNYSSRLMQDLGINLWSWLFQGPIVNILEHSIGIANGKNRPLRLRLDIRDPNLIALPWEIMQSQAGKPSISLSQHLLFSRTTNNVESLPILPASQSLNVLLAIGANSPASTKLSASAQHLHLEEEAEILVKALTGYELANNSKGIGVKCNVDTLVQPTPEQLITQLETKNYNVFFYAGHGLSDPDGGIIYLRPDRKINGTELAQVLTRCQVKLCVFNACWLAQPATSEAQTLQNSSLAEVLIHHGVPAVLGMRDQITDEEALSFIQTFAQALAARHPIDRAVAIARQQLITIYKFNFPAWTLPILYLHPEFDGELVRPAQEEVTQLPNGDSRIRLRNLKASLRSLSVPKKTWSLQGEVAFLGRLNENNDIAIEEPWISKQHAKIFYRNEKKDGTTVPTYFISDNSRFGTLIFDSNGWQNIHRQEVPLRSGMQIKFGCSQGETFEFIVETQPG